jgi:hypothetical protein
MATSEEPSSPEKPPRNWPLFAYITAVVALISLGALLYGAFAAGRESKLATPRPETAKGAATSQRSRGTADALAAAANLASTLGKTAGTTTAVGEETLRDFLRQVGFPLTEKGVSGLASALWKRYGLGKSKSPPLPTSAGESETTNVVLVLRDVGGRLRVIRVPTGEIILPRTP